MNEKNLVRKNDILSPIERYEASLFYHLSAGIEETLKYLENFNLFERVFWIFGSRSPEYLGAREAYRRLKENLKES